MSLFTKNILSKKWNRDPVSIHCDSRIPYNHQKVKLRLL